MALRRIVSDSAGAGNVLRDVTSLSATTGYLSAAPNLEPYEPHVARPAACFPIK